MHNLAEVFAKPMQKDMPMRHWGNYFVSCPRRHSPLRDWFRGGGMEAQNMPMHIVQLWYHYLSVHNVMRIDATARILPRFKIASLNNPIAVSVS